MPLENLVTFKNNKFMNFWKNRSVFVTGGTGFLGVWLTEKLVALGANVTVLVRDWTPNAPFFLENISQKVNIVRGSLEDASSVERAISEYECETVFHLAAQPIVSVANRHPVATFEANIQGTWNLLEACRKLDHVKRIVIASSDKAYGDHDILPYNEDFALQGRHPYDVSKSCADLIALTYHHTYKLPITITRCGNLFGARDMNFSRIIPGTVKSLYEGEIPIIRSDGSPKRDYVHVADIADAYLLLAEKMENPEVVGKAYNFGTGEPLSVLELTQKILTAAGSDIEPKVLNEAKGEILHQYLNPERAIKELGWQPVCSIDQRLKETVDWYNNYLAQTSQG